MVVNPPRNDKRWESSSKHSWTPSNPQERREIRDTTVMKIFPATARIVGQIASVQSNVLGLKSKMTSLGKSDVERLEAAAKKRASTKRTTNQKSSAEAAPSKKPKVAATKQPAVAAVEPRKLRAWKDEAVTANKKGGVRAGTKKAQPAATGPAAPALVAAESRALTKEEMDELKQNINLISENQLSAEVRRLLKHPSEAKKKEGSCNCFDECVDCDCQKKCRYTSKGLLNRRLLNLAIVECGGYCGCKGRCRNRVTQDGPMPGLELVMTANRGIGLRTTKAVKKGACTVEYLGEVLLNSSKKLSKDYAFNLVSMDGTQKFCLDAKRNANYARFVNHSCKPNLWARPVYTCDADDRIPRIAFFALEDIPAGTELTIDYHRDMTLEDIVALYGDDLIDCKCGAEGCRGKL